MLGSRAVERRDPTAGLHPRARLMSETLAAKWAELVTQALLLLLLPRALGPPAYGEFAVAFAVASILGLGLGLGAPLAAIRYVPAAAPAERLARARAVATSVAAARARVLGAGTVAALALGPLVLDLPVLVVLAVCVAAWSSVGSSIASELALALGRARVWNARFPLENALVIGLALAGHAAFGTHGAIAGMALGCVVVFALLLRVIVRDLRGAPTGPALPAEASAYARLQSLTAIIGTLVTRGSPVAMAVAGASSTETAFAAIATGVGAAGAHTFLGLLLVHLPRLSEESREAPARAEEEARRSAWDALGVALAVALPAAFLAGPAIDAVVGKEFGDARAAVALALPALPLGAAVGFAHLVASLRLRAGLLTAAWATGGVAFAAIAAATIPSLDAKGASLALTGGFGATCVAATVLLGRRTLGPAALAAFAAAAATLGSGAAGGAVF
jgi:O-antigen/teichoic acid export membrane protein